LEVLTQKFAI